MQGTFCRTSTRQFQDMHALSLACYNPAILKCAPDECRQPLAPLPQPHSDPPQQQQQQHHSSLQQSRQAAGAQQPVVHKEPQHKPPQQQHRQPQQLQQAQLQQQQQKRRVREDENSVIVRGNRYTKLECVGRGGSSKVFKVRIMIVMQYIHLVGTEQKGGASTTTSLSHVKTLLQRLLALVLTDSRTVLQGCCDCLIKIKQVRLSFCGVCLLTEGDKPRCKAGHGCLYTSDLHDLVMCLHISLQQLTFMLVL